jgi:uncharacterized membrane protein
VGQCLFVYLLSSLLLMLLFCINIILHSQTSYSAVVKIVPRGERDHCDIDHELEEEKTSTK